MHLKPYVYVLAALSAGCLAVEKPASDLASRQLALPAAFGASVPTTNPGVREGAEGWLDRLGSPTVGVLVEEAVARNYDLQAAAARWEEARALTRSAAAGLRPRVDYQAAASRERAFSPTGNGDTSNVYTAGIAASWELDLWGRLRSQREAAAEGEAAARLDYVFARQSLAAAVADAWVVAVTARKRLEIDTERLEAEQRTQRITQNRADVGAGNNLDAELSLAGTSIAASAVLADKAAIAETRRALELLLGRYPAAEIEAEAALPVIRTMTPDVLPSELLSRRPDIAAADRRVAAAFYDHEVAKRSFFPTISLNGSLSHGFDPSQLLWQIAGNALGPLYEGGRLQAAVDAASARQKQALAGYANLALSALREVESAMANERFLVQREQELADATRRFAAASQIAENRYGAGVISIVDLQTVRRQDFDARAQYLDVQASRVRERIALYRALGGAFEAAPLDAQPNQAPAGPNIAQ